VTDPHTYCRSHSRFGRCSLLRGTPHTTHVILMGDDYGFGYVIERGRAISRGYGRLRDGVFIPSPV
jgi:hypothetical protein